MGEIDEFVEKMKKETEQICIGCITIFMIVVVLLLLSGGCCG